MTQERLNELLSSFGNRRIAVLGDYFLDRYLDFDSDLAELSIETGKVANQVVAVRHFPGAAGTVVCNLHALGCGMIINISMRGDDGEGYELCQDLTAMGCVTDHLLVVPERRTPVYCKPRNIRVPGLEGESERFDTKNRETTPKWVEDKLIAAVEGIIGQVDALIVLDQVEEENCGAVTKRMRERLLELATPQNIIWADSRNRIGKFSGLIIKPNQHEAVAATMPGYSGEIDDELVQKAGLSLSGKSGKPVFVTRGERGMLVFNGTRCEAVRGVHVDGPTDPTGAGDSVTASAVLALASGAKPEEAALIANLVASITVQQIGATGTASPSQLPGRLEIWRAQGT